MRARKYRNVDNQVDYKAWLIENGIDVSKIDDKGNVKMRCPACNHEEFYFNVNTGKYQCWRKNHCGIMGNAFTLIKNYGFTPLQISSKNYPKKEKEEVENKEIDFSYLQNELYQLFSVKTGKYADYIPDWVLELFEERKIDRESLIVANVCWHKSKKCLAFPRMNLEKKVMGVKYRFAPDKKSKFKQEANSTSCFFNLHNFKSKRLIIAEGETDTLSLIALGYVNECVGVPAGSIKSCKSWLDANDVVNKVDEIILALDNDEAGKDTIKAFLVEYEGQAVIKKVDLKDYKDVSQYYVDNQQELMLAIENAKVIMSDKILNISSIEESDKPAIEINFPSYEYILGGMREGEVTVLLGRASAGKTTYAYQLVSCIADKEIKIGVLSGEMTLSKTKNWIYSKLVPRSCIVVKPNKFNPNFLDVTLKPKVKEALDKVYEDYISIYDNSSWNSKDLFNAMKELARAGHKVIVLDNLSVVDVGVDEVFGMKAFINDIRNLAVLYELHIIIVSHPRKTLTPNSKLSLDDIYGTGAAGKLAHNVVVIERTGDNETRLSCLKVRNYGVYDDLEYRLTYDKRSARFVTEKNDVIHINELDRTFLWEKKISYELRKEIFSEKRC